jgi:NADP-dependent 3-hydroxy acid dehydrogenase YdfG
MAWDLKGQVAVVTGGGSGIGSAVAKMLFSHGCRVVCGGRTLSKLQEVKQSIAADSSNFLVHEIDVSCEKSVHQFFEFVRQKFGNTDILVNSAGVNVKLRTMQELSIEDWNRMLQINSSGPFFCAREVLAGMREKKNGLVINISSVAGLRSGPLGGIGYNSSKFAVTGFGICLGSEEREAGIRVSNIYPGEVDTPILKDRPRPVTEEHRARILQPEDVSAAVEMVVKLPPRARIPELTIIPTVQDFV